MSKVGKGFRAGASFVFRTLSRHPWIILAWLLLAGLTVAAQKVVPQPWSAGIQPVALIVAMWVFSLASPEED
jgi:hypothetical protein